MNIEHCTEARHNEQSTSTDSHTQDVQNNPSDFGKPIFLKDQDVHGSVKPPRTQWLTNVENKDINSNQLIVFQDCEGYFLRKKMVGKSTKASKTGELAYSCSSTKTT
jgi:hypothetical protein